MKSHSSHHYIGLAIMAVLSFIAMYILMYAMVATGYDILPNANQFFMATIMTMPMVLIELFIMRSMYADKKINAAVIVACCIIFFASFMMLRQQTFIGDKQLLKSMIPHHSGAVLMCERASLKDDDVRELCTSIIASQQAEIDFMKAKLRSLR